MNNNKVEKFTFAEVFGEGSCDKENQLFRYFEKKLSGEEKKDIETHLANCNFCPKLLALLRQEEEILETAIDPTIAKEQYEKNRTRLRSHLDLKFSSAEKAFPPVRKSAGFPGYVNAMMLLLIAGLLYPAYRSFVLDQQVTEVASQLKSERSKRQIAEDSLRKIKPEEKNLVEPVISSPMIYSARPERAEKDRTINIRFDAENPVQNIVFALPPANEQNYSVVVSKDSRTVWQKQIRVDTESPLISLSLPASYFQTGNYLLTISRQGTTWVYEVNLQVSREN